MWDVNVLFKFCLSGHLSLVREARSTNDFVVASIYVNPSQFAPNEDLKQYPRSLIEDKEALEKLGVDLLFCPSEMYSQVHRCYIEPLGFDELREGKARPGHFRGVATIVNKLLNIVQPTRAYFGQKDAAQCILIKRLVADMDLDVEIQIMETIREKDGLAMSSRNAYLDQKERDAAVVIFQSLTAAKEIFESSFAGNLPMDANIILETVSRVLQSEPLVKDIEYIAVDCKETMGSLQQIGPGGAIVSLAVKVGNVRLIDNIVL